MVRLSLICVFVCLCPICHYSLKKQSVLQNAIDQWFPDLLLFAYPQTGNRKLTYTLIWYLRAFSSIFTNNLKLLAYPFRFFTYPWGYTYPRLRTTAIDNHLYKHSMSLCMIWNKWKLFQWITCKRSPLICNNNNIFKYFIVHNS